MLVVLWCLYLTLAILSMLLSSPPQHTHSGETVIKRSPALRSLEILSQRLEMLLIDCMFVCLSELYRFLTLMLLRRLL